LLLLFLPAELLSSLKVVSFQWFGLWSNAKHEIDAKSPFSKKGYVGIVFGQLCLQLQSHGSDSVLLPISHYSGSQVTEETQTLFSFFFLCVSCDLTNNNHIKLKLLSKMQIHRAM